MPLIYSLFQNCGFIAFEAHQNNTILEASVQTHFPTKLTISCGPLLKTTVQNLDAVSNKKLRVVSLEVLMCFLLVI